MSIGEICRLEREIGDKDKDFSSVCSDKQKIEEELFEYKSLVEIQKKELEKLTDLNKQKDTKITDLNKQLDNAKKKIKQYENNKVMSIPKIDCSKKTYMDYKCIGKNTSQGKIVYNNKAWTDEDGLRMWGEYYCVALGSYYGKVGDTFLVETDKGNKYKIIKADEKADKHTDSSNRYTIATGCMMEWIVETNKLSTYVRRSGNINNVDKVSGSIVKITKIKG